MTRPCHRCKKQTWQEQEITGELVKWICTKCHNIAWVGLRRPLQPIPPGKERPER